MILTLIIFVGIPLLLLFSKMREREVATKKAQLANAIQTLTAPKRDEKAAAEAAKTLAALMVDANEEQMAKLNSPPIGTFALAYLIEKNKR